MTVKYEKTNTDILSLFTYLKSQYMIKSLLYRKQAKIDIIDNNAMITWGPSIIIGGKFSNTIGEKLKLKVTNKNGPYYIYSPEGEWLKYIENTFTESVIKKQINLYQFNEFMEINNQIKHGIIVQVTNEWFQNNLLDVKKIKDEIYSYSSIEDFLQNGFGLVLIIENRICGYCLSEYSIDNECAISIWIDEKYRGSGYAKIMTNTFLHYTKNKNWNIYWACDSNNIPSNKIAQGTGFLFHSKIDYYELKKYNMEGCSDVGFK